MMASETIAIPGPRSIRVKRLILPVEHGAWGFLFEPLVASLAIAGSAGGVWIAVMIIALFFARQPLKFFLLGLVGNGHRQQTFAALRLLLIFGAVFAVSLAVAAAFTDPWVFFPFLVVAPLASYQIFCDLSHKSRELLPELTGAVAISSSAAAVALAGGMPWPAAMALWAVFIARLIPSVLYVRARLRLVKGKPARPLIAVGFQAAALLAVGALVFFGLASYLTLAVFALLLWRAAIGLSHFRKDLKAVRIGIAEVIYGVLTVISIIAGHYLGF